MMKMRIIGALALSAAVMATCGDAMGDEPAAPEAAAKADTAAKTDAAKDSVLVEVNGQKLTKAELEADIGKMLDSYGIPAEQREMAKQQMQGQIVQQFIVKNLLLAEAKRQNIVVNEEDRKSFADEFAKKMADAPYPDGPKTIEEALEKSPFGKERAKREFDESLTIEKLIKTTVTDKIATDKAKVDEILKGIEEDNAKIKAENEKLGGANAEAKALEKIKGLKKQLDEGADFAELAKANSDCPSGAQGGALGEFTRGRMVKEFEDAAFSLELGKVSEPVKTVFGYHLILVTKKNPAVAADGDKPPKEESVEASHILVKTPELQEERPVPSREEVEQYVKRMAEDKAISSYIEKLVTAADVKACDEFKMFLPQKPAPDAEPKADEAK